METGWSVYWSERDTSWVISYKRLNGKWSTKVVPREEADSPKARSPAERYGAAWYANYARNGGKVVALIVPPAPALTTQSEWDGWIKEREENPNIRAATIKQNKGHKALIFAHPMSLKDLDSLKPEDAKSFVIYAREGGKRTRAAYTVRNIVNSYSAFVGSRLQLSANPFHHAAVRAELPSPKPRWGRDKPHIPPDSIATFVLCDSPIIPKWRWVKNAVAVLGGAREGELQGLRWKFIYFEHHIPHYKLVEALALETKKGYAQLDELKTENSFRLVPFHSIALARMKWWWETGWALWTGRKPTLDDYVFPNNEGQSWRPKAAIYLRQDLGAAKLDQHYNGHLLTEHALRRSFSTLLHQAGVPTSTIEELLGHADGSTAMDHYIFRYLKPHAAAIARIKIGVRAKKAATA